MNGKWKKILYWVTVGLLLAVIVVCAVIIGYKLISDAQNKQEYSELESLKNSASANVTRPSISESTGTSSEDTTQSPTLPSDPELSDPDGMLTEYKLLYEINNDMVGWIKIEGTDIDYPVVQSPYKANFYLRRNFYKKSATCGTIYVREACDVFEPSDNVTIYGHNMRNGTMFADLHLYEDKSFWEDNRYIFFDTLYEYHTYEIFAVFISTADLSVGFSYHTFDNALSEEHYDSFVAQCKELSLYDTGITPQYGEKLITLSTCDKSIEDGRFVVVARRVV